MVKVIIHQRYGAFSLSDRAFARYKELGGHSLCCYTIHPRHEQALVQGVEEMGDSAQEEWGGDGYGQGLRIGEVEGLYRIVERDGAERIETPDSIEWVDSSDGA